MSMPSGVDAPPQATSSAETGASPARPSSGLHGLYDDVMAHYHRCQMNAATLTDTWLETLKHRGAFFAYDDMLQMLAPGNKVNSWIDDLHYLIDPTMLDLSDPIVRRLLEGGESDVGAPRKDLVIEGQRFSSNFIHYVGDAARIIHAAEAQGFDRPTILEIGSGLGGLVYLLRRYFGDRLTLYLVDIPETLLLQEWYLRACFPEASTAFKATQEAAAFQPGGLNFVNAYVLESQPIPFDVAVNSDSMQEMSRDTAAGYLRYVERHISPHGVFYFQNHFGHSTLSVPEPSEYPWDAHWTIAAAELASQMECCAESEQARFIFVRSETPEDVDTRRLVLRLLWNGFVSGRLPNAPGAINELTTIPRHHAPATAVGAIHEVLARHGVPIGPELVAPLHTAMYFPHTSFVSLFQPEPVGTHEPKRFAQRQAETVWCLQSALLQFMEAVAADPGRWTAIRAAEAVATLCTRQLPRFEDTARSEYWTAYAAAILFALGQGEPARRLLAEGAARSTNPFWLIRFAHLASRFRCSDERDTLISRLCTQQEPLDYYVAMKLSELEHAQGNTQEAHRRLRKLELESRGKLPRLSTLAKTAVRTNALDIACSTYRKIWETFPEFRIAQALHLLKVAPSVTAQANVRAFVSALLEQEGSRAMSGDTAVYGALLIELGQRQHGLQGLVRAAEQYAADYFRLGQIAKWLQEAGCDELADNVLAQSLTLRPGSFLHHDFVGNVYFAARRYDRAREHYLQSIAMKPYLRHIQAKALYCALPDAVRQQGVFGAPEDVPLIFQRKQDFYHDLGLSNK